MGNVCTKMKSLYMRSIMAKEVKLYSSFNLGARWGWVVSTTPWPLYPLEKIWYPLGR